MKTKYPLIVVSVTLLSSVFCGSSFADGDEIIDSIVSSIDDSIKTWQIFFWISLASIIIVGVLGAIIATLQGIDQVKYKTLTIVFGAVITLCTFLSNSVLKGDYRLYDTIQKEARLRKAVLSGLIEKFKAAETAEAKNGLIPVLLKETRLINQLETKPALDADGTAMLEFQFVNSAYADSPPNWLTALPEDNDYLYFRGSADSESIANLETAANKNAMQNAADFMAKQFGPEAKNIDTRKLAGLIADSAELYSSYISSTDNKTYRYYSLIRISKNTMKMGARLFGVANNVEIPETLIAKIDTSQRARDDYMAKQTKLYEDQEDQIKNDLPSELYSKYLKARQLRREEHNNLAAIPLLKEILQQSAGFYLGWYNLALAYDALKEKPAAEEAYKRAIELESKSLPRDATLYNSYGLFLHKQKQYQDALIQYKKSLSLDPENPRTQNNLIELTKDLKSN